MTVKWAREPESVTRRVNVHLDGAPIVESDKVTCRPFKACWIVLNGTPVRVIVTCDLVTGPESKSGGVLTLTWTLLEQPDWLDHIMREALR